MHWGEIKIALCGSLYPLGKGSEHGLRPSPDQASSRDSRAAVHAFGPITLFCLKHNPHLPALPQTPYLVTDQIPLLLIVVLPQEPGLVRGQVHGALRREPKSAELNAPPTRRREKLDYAYLSLWDLQFTLILNC